MRDSFDKKKFSTLMDRKHEEDPSEESSSQPSTQAQLQGKKFHKELADQINKKKSRSGIEGQLLQWMETAFNCTFLRAEVGICGYAVKKSKVDFYNGKIDAVALRGNLKDRPEVIVVDWKTSTRNDLQKLVEWWDGAKNFKKPLYQCLLYRELLQTHLEVSDLRASISIMLVPFHHVHQEGWPGLCTNFEEMDRKGLLKAIKEYQWLPWGSECVHTVTLPSNLFSSELVKDTYVEDGILKEETRVKDVVKESATIRDMCEELGLLKLKIENSPTKKRPSRSLFKSKKK